MDLAGRTVWQQASGDTKRDYSSLCIRLGVILNGYDEELEPSPQGILFESLGYHEQTARCSPPGIRSLEVTENKRRDLIRFCETMKEGDIVVLRRGTNTVLGVGILVGSCFEEDNFADVDGWYLPLARNTTWFWTEPKKFQTYDLKQGDTTQRILESGAVWKWLKTIPEPPPLPQPYPYIKFPQQEKISREQIADYLFDQGSGRSAIMSLLEQIGELEGIARWYQRSDRSPSEAETIAYLVAPLLRALGWTPQKMAIEWKYIDVALFGSLPRTIENIHSIVEVKKMNAACLAAEDQARRYASAAPNCQRIVLTDGLRYGVYLRTANGDFKLRAYLNLIRMRDQYPIWDCKGAAEALHLMTPDAGK